MRGKLNRHLAAYSAELEQALKEANEDKAAIRAWAEGLEQAQGK